MSIIKDTFFGGAEKNAAEATERGLNRSMDQMQQGTEQARSEVMSAFPQSQESLRQGAQGALDVMGQFLPQQANVFQQGSLNAQNQLAAGLPQIQNALMGGNVDFSQLQPRNINFDQGIFNQQLPNMQPQQQGATGLSQAALNQSPNQFNPNMFLSGEPGQSSFSNSPFNTGLFNMPRMELR